MKKFLSIIILIFYTCMSMGATVNVHYCMGEFKSVNFVLSKEGCKHCGKSKSSGCSKDCCKDKIKILKTEKDQKAENAFNSFLQLSGLLPITKISVHIFLDYAPSATVSIPWSNGPPRSSRTPFYIFACIFRI